MAKAQLKLLLFLIVLGITLGSMATAYYIYDKVLSPHKRVQEEIATIKRGDVPRMDPGEKRFDAAVELIREGRIEDGRDALFKLINQFPDSPTCVEAKRIIGEINMDQLYAAESKAGKKDYIVQPGDSLALIAGKQGTTVDLLIRLNGLMGTMLQPGDHLAILPLEFSIHVKVGAKTVSLWRKVGEREFFFKEYLAQEIRLPAGVRVPAEMEIKGKSAVKDGKVLLTTDLHYAEADKWLPGSRSGVVLRTPPKPKAVAVAEPAAENQAAPAVPDLEDGPEPGIFLAREDLEEMFALVRNGSKLYIIR
ncbi:LysM peptidoglycan-binding domain-containing protein [Prosthecobacter sp. SYSU 5D2]|uniref:LysM peptidoglycan-binding domain-containing protein n=1 Tax=Prosthecobacter sp. SYSU 5D2 TaxID=3134134 RepID=UPI0031FEFDD7